jgi:hypothetical protein
MSQTANQPASQVMTTGTWTFIPPGGAKMTATIWTTGGGAMTLIMPTLRPSWRAEVRGKVRTK